MANVERRRAIRRAVLQEEAAVIHAEELELPAKIIDLSRYGALVSFIGVPALGSRDFVADDTIELRMQNEDAMFHVMTRVVRTGPQFIAVEFVVDKEDVQRNIGDKLLRIEARSDITKAKGATGSA